MNPKVLCEIPTAGKQGTRIDRWKYDAIRNAILATVPEDETGVEFVRLSSVIERTLSSSDRERLGSISWYTTVVKLDLEVRGEIERVPGSKPQRLCRSR